LRAPRSTGARAAADRTLVMAMRTLKIPKGDSIDKLARFWATHDLTEFEDQLEEVAEPVFERKSFPLIAVRLHPQEAAAVKRVAKQGPRCPAGNPDSAVGPRQTSEQQVLNQTVLTLATKRRPFA